MFSFLPAYRLVRVFSAIIRPQSLIMDRGKPHRPRATANVSGHGSCDHLAQMPASIGMRPVPAKITGNQPAELQKSAAYPLVRDVDATLGQQILDITKRQREPGIEPDRVLDDHRRKAMSLEGYRGHSATLKRQCIHGQPLNVSMPAMMTAMSSGRLETVLTGLD